MDNNIIEISEKKRLYFSMVLPMFFLLLIWSIKIFEEALGISFAIYGVLPRTIEGLVGIITSPLIHANFKHLINNSVPFFILSVATFYFYRPLGYKVILLTYLITGIWVWCGGRQTYHIGASGVVYGLAFFLVFSGIFRKVVALAAVSLAVIFFYGSMIWGLFPFVPDISYESHLSGALAGFILALMFKNEGPQREVYDWENTDDDEDDINAKLDAMLNERSNAQVGAKNMYLYPKNNHQALNDTENISPKSEPKGDKPGS